MPGQAFFIPAQLGQLGQLGQLSSLGQESCLYGEYVAPLRCVVGRYMPLSHFPGTTYTLDCKEHGIPAKDGIDRIDDTHQPCLSLIPLQIKIPEKISSFDLATIQPSLLESTITGLL